VYKRQLMSDYPEESIDLTKESVGCIIKLRQCDVGWEYKTPFADWQKANNREHALEYAAQDAITQRTPAAQMRVNAQLKIQSGS